MAFPVPRLLLVVPLALLLAAGGAYAAEPANKAKPTAPAPVSDGSYSCAPAAAATRKPGSVQALVCGDAQLLALDRKLGAVIVASQKREPSTAVLPQTIALVQKQWLEDRDACATAPNTYNCVRGLYRARIAELQGQYRLVPAHGPFRFACTGAEAGPLVITFFDTDPPSASMETERRTDLLFVAPSGSGARYVGGEGVQYWEHQGVATVTWGEPGKEAACTRAS
ncbi:MAG: MliC family protein [Proteobacteria bacterium]|nr:MliC family protein [Pseudomonadota bacterium]